MGKKNSRLGISFDCVLLGEYFGEDCLFVVMKETVFRLSFLFRRLFMRFD